MSTRLVTLLSTPYSKDVMLLRVILEGRGIPVFVDDDVLVTEGLVGGGVEARLRVPERRLAAAEEAFADYFAGERRRMQADHEVKQLKWIWWGIKFEGCLILSAFVLGVLGIITTGSADIAWTCLGLIVLVTLGIGLWIRWDLEAM